MIPIPLSYPTTYNNRIVTNRNAYGASA